MRRLSININLRSALAAAVAKSAKASADILHNGVIEHLGRCVGWCGCFYNSALCNLAWDGFYGGFFVFKRWRNFL